MVDADGTPGRFGRTVATLRAATTNRMIARAVVAFGAFTLSEWAIWIAMLVYAFERGGATAAGIVAVVQLLPSAILAPVISGYGDRLPRERLLLASYVVQATGMTATAFALATGAEPIVVYVLASATTIGIGMTRPAHFSLLPSLARTPDELTAANVASSTVQNLAILVAPAMAGLILAAAGAQAVFALTAIISAGEALLVATIRTEPMARVAPRPPAPIEGEVDADGARLVARLAAHDEDEVVGLVDGLRLLRRHVGSRTIVILIGAGSLIEGALDIIGVVLALELLETGEAGVGILGSAVGLGGLIGAAIATALVGRRRLAGPFALGLILWGAPLAIVGLLPLPVLALLLFVVAGVGRSLMDVAGRTLLQRVAPPGVLAGVLGSLEGLHDLMLAAGTIAVPDPHRAVRGAIGDRPRRAVAAGGRAPDVAVCRRRRRARRDPRPGARSAAGAADLRPAAATDDRVAVRPAAGRCRARAGRDHPPGPGRGPLLHHRRGVVRGHDRRPRRPDAWARRRVRRDRAAAAGAPDGVRLGTRADVAHGPRTGRVPASGHRPRRVPHRRRRPGRAAPRRGPGRSGLRGLAGRRPLSSVACSTPRRSSTSSATRRSSG